MNDSIPAESSHGLWSQARARLRRSWVARISVWLVTALFVIAAAAPFLANRTPLLYRDDAGIQFPVLSGFRPEDWFWAAVVVIALVLRLLITRIAADKRSLALLGAVGITLIIAVICGLIPERLDREHWQKWTELRDRGAAANESVVWPAVAYDASEFDRQLFRAEGPSPRHWFGTDQGGRDIFARVIYGTRVSLLTGFLSVAIALTVGVVMGATAGYFGGVVDLLLSRAIEVVQCFPPLVLILAITAFVTPTTGLVIALIGLLSWPSVARLVRSEFLRLRNEEFVLAARAMGASPWRLISRHLLPNAMAPVFVVATFGIANAILTEAALSFLGLGVPPPTPSWGQILHQGRSVLTDSPWITLAPGIFVLVAVSVFNVLGEQLRDALDPRYEKRLYG